MSEREDKLREKIEREDSNRIDESRDISKMEAPDKWPDPPPENDDKKESGSG